MASRYQFSIGSLFLVAAATGAGCYFDGPTLGIPLGGAAMAIVAWWRRTCGILHPQVLRFHCLQDRRVVLGYDPDLFGRTDLSMILKSSSTRPSNPSTTAGTIAPLLIPG